MATLKDGCSRSNVVYLIIEALRYLADSDEYEVRFDLASASLVGSFVREKERCYFSITNEKFMAEFNPPDYSANWARDNHNIRMMSEFLLTESRYEDGTSPLSYDIMTTDRFGDVSDALAGVAKRVADELDLSFQEVQYVESGKHWVIGMTSKQGSVGHNEAFSASQLARLGVRIYDDDIFLVGERFYTWLRNAFANLKGMDGLSEDEIKIEVRNDAAAVDTNDERILIGMSITDWCILCGNRSDTPVEKQALRIAHMRLCDEVGRAMDGINDAEYEKYSS